MALSKQELKQIKKLQQKKYRQQEQLFLAEGYKLVVHELIPSKINIKNILISQDWIAKYDINAISHLNIEIISNKDFKQISTQKNPEGILAVCEQPIYNIDDYTNKWIIGLDYLQDPGNLGTIIRIADWFNISAIICSNNTVDMYNPKVIQASMGSIVRVPIIYKELNDFLKTTTANIYTATLSGTSIYKINNLQPGIIIIGNESNGVCTDIQKLATQSISIPNFGGAESLNAGVATGIILSHLVQS